MKSVISWNVNGIRAVWKKDFPEWFKKENPDFLCLQETKVHKEQLTEEQVSPEGYHSYWESAEKKGYSGLAVYSKEPCLEERNLGKTEFDVEGRVQILEYEKFTLINTYFPNSQEKGKRIDYKLAYCKEILKLCKKLDKEGRKFVLCGDLNIAHKPIDLYYPKPNEGNPGYLPEERAWMDKFTKAGFIDVFREFNKKAHQYTWWSYRTRARDRNIGWRLDYHLTNKIMFEDVKDCLILSEILGSDHCPVKLLLKT